jgi:hypothetical protein
MSDERCVDCEMCKCFAAKGTKATKPIKKKAPQGDGAAKRRHSATKICQKL